MNNSFVLLFLLETLFIGNCASSELFDIKTSVEIVVSKNGEFGDILCNVPLLGLKECTFVKPNGDNIVIPSINTSIEDGMPGSSCSLPISVWSNEIYGEWMLLIRQERNISIPVEVERDIGEKYLASPSLRKAHVVRGEVLEIKCSDDIGWDFCQIYGPNQQMLHSRFFHGIKSHDPCSLTIGKADNNHKGDWICRHGFGKKTTAITTMFTVVIEDKMRVILRKFIKPRYVEIDNPPGILTQCDAISDGKINSDFFNQIKKLNNCGFPIENLDGRYGMMKKLRIKTTYLNHQNDSDQMNDIFDIIDVSEESILPNVFSRDGKYEHVDFNRTEEAESPVNCTFCYGRKGQSSGEFEVIKQLGRTEQLQQCTFRFAVKKNYENFTFAIIEDSQYPRIGYFHVVIERDEKIEQFHVTWRKSTTRKLQLSSYENYSCNLVRANGYRILYRNSNCTFEVNDITQEDGGLWIASYDVGNKIVQEHFNVSIQDSPEVMIHYKQEKGIFVSCVTMKKDFQVENCQFRSPSGAIIGAINAAENEGYRFSTIETNNENGCKVSSIGQYPLTDWGEWACKLENEKDSITAWTHINQIVPIIESNPISVSPIEHGETLYVTDYVSENAGRITLKCAVEMSSYRECSMFRPDGTMIDNSMTRYLLLSKEKCELHILQPVNIDFGNWTCSMKFDNLIINSTIKVDESVEKIKKELRSNRMNSQVERGEDFMINCKISVPIESCQMKNPNGVNYDLSDGDSYSSEIAYKGEGLKSGDCSALVKSAGRWNTGDWTCILGLTGNVQVESKYRVELLESFLIPDVITDTTQLGKTLSCRASFGNTRIIDYCRWVHPDGTEISIKHNNKFQVGKTHKTCNVLMKSFDEANFGEWKCFAFISDSPGREINAIVKFGERREKKHEAFFDYKFNMIFGFFVFLLILGFIYIYCMHNRAP